MSDLPPICTIIPCYNREDTVAAAVRSVLEQEYPAEHRVICVDDGSSDRTLEVLHSLGDPRLTITSNTGKNGPSGARNHGAALADTPWIAFQDSDDLWLPNRLARQMPQILSDGAVAGYCAMVIKEDTDPQTPVQDRFPRPGTAPLAGDILPSLTMGSFISTQMLILRRDIFEQVGGFDADLPALVDWELMLRVAQTGPVDYLDEELVIQRMSPNSITRSSKKRLAAQEYILAKHQALFARYPAALAQHHHRIAGAHRMVGQFQEAAPHAWAAARSAPGRVKYLLNALYLQTRRITG